MDVQVTIDWWFFLLLFVLPVRTIQSEGCQCPGATILAQFPSSPPAEACCLNYSGSMLDHVPWVRLNNRPKLQILDLSHCNMTTIDLQEDTWTSTSPLQEVYLGHNQLASLPEGFMSHLPNLRVLELGMNHLRELPEDFLQGSDHLQELDLRGNLLRSLPASVLSLPGLERLELGANPWDCSCSLIEGLDNNNHNSSLQSIVGNISCASPSSLVGRLVWSVPPGDVCRPMGLTVLFILLPLLILLCLVSCWCCGRTKNRKEPSAFGPSKKKPSHLPNGHHHHHHHHQPCLKPPGGGTGDITMEGLLNNQLLLRPSSTLLGSIRDIYEEVEIKLGSVESPAPSSPSAGSSFTEGVLAGPGSQDEGLEVGQNRAADLDAVSVTEVMKDSADREKAYMTQSTKYYSLVPGMELDGSEHSSEHGSEHGPEHGSEHGSEYGLEHGSEHGPEHGPEHGSEYGLEHGPEHGSEHRTEHGPEHGSEHGLDNADYDSVDLS